MRVLGIESSSSLSGIALVGGSGVIAEHVFEHNQGLLVGLAPAIATIVKQPSDVEGIAVSIGPGSFTGLRIGVSTAKALAFVWRVPVAAVSTIDALAVTVAGSAEDQDAVMALMIRSRRDEVFGAVYAMARSAPTAVVPVRCLSVQEFLAAVDALDADRIIVAGDAAELYRDRIEASLSRAELAAPAVNYPSPTAVAWLGRDRLLRGQAEDTLALAPEYHRRTYVGTA
jgi:tRNA threonylcarbamoyladenosine biosynthesis protein TsaB